MRRLLLLLILFVIFSGKNLFAQTPGIVGTNAFFAGAWLEIGEQSNGDFGASVAAPGYHDHCAACDNPTPLAEVYDYGHDGWTVGAPAYMGDYTYPGSPFEGWEIQFTATGASRAQAFCAGGAAGVYTNVGGAGLTGAFTGFSDAGGQQIASWAGTASGGNLTIKQATEVDTFGSAVVITTKLYNTSAANIDSIYYMRSCDPDNNETWGGSFITENWIDYQNTDLYHRVQVHATTDIPTPNLYPFALGTKDCRAVCLIYEDWPMSDAQNLTPVWDKSYVGGGSWYTISAGAPDVTDDIAIALVFQIGTICPGDSNFVSYAYTFNGVSGIDSALPEPALNVNGITITPAVLPNATYDTFNTCLYPGMTTLPVNIINATTGDWTWSTWTWSPGTGLSTTAGVTNIINITALPPEITYTITGTGYTTSCGSPAICATRVFYLTIHTCNGATNNNPCIGDTVIFNAPGDSLGATYAWVGPNSYTTTVATTQTFTVYPSVWADTGTYYVIKTISGTSDTSITHLTLYPIPSVTASSNSPLCIGAANTLSLTATPGTVPVTTYGWTGPDGFTSALQDPTIPGFTAPDTGIYKVVVTTAAGCNDSGTTEVVLRPPPVAPIVTDPPAYCFGSTFVPFNISGITGTVYWYPTAAGGTGSTTTPSVNTSVPGTYTFYYGQTVGLCESPIDSITIVVYPPIVPAFTYTIHRGCTEDTVDFFNSSTGTYTSDLWSFGDGSATSTSMASTVQHIYTTQSAPTWVVTLTDYFATCSESATQNIDTRHTIQAAFKAHLDTICAGESSTMTNLSEATVQGVTIPQTAISSFTWNWADGTPNQTEGNPSALGHTFTKPGVYDVSMTATDSIGCTSTATEYVYVIGFTITSWHDTSICLKQPLPLTNEITQNPELGLTDYTYTWTSPTGLPFLNSDDVQIPDFSNAFGSYTYTLTVNLPGAWGNCEEKDTMIIHSILGKKLQDTTASTTINYGSSIQLNADSLLYYWWLPDNGTLSNPNINNPIATPDTTTTYIVYGMDMYGCVDSAFITITVDSNMTEAIPTAFTPNNDGLNDYFRPVGLVFQNIVDFRVFNRWGQQVFYTNSSTSKGWDGTFNGVPCDMDVYFYTITIYRPDHGDNVQYKGNVTLIR